MSTAIPISKMQEVTLKDITNTPKIIIMLACLLGGLSNICAQTNDLNPCSGDQITYENTVGGGGPFASVIWTVSPNSGYTNATTASNGDYTLTWTETGNYVVKVTDQSNSSNYDTYNVNVLGVDGGTLSVTPSEICKGETVDFTITNYSGINLVLENMTTGATYTSFSNVPVSRDSQFRMRVSPHTQCGGADDYSNTISVTVNDFDEGEIVASYSGNLCENINKSITLSATGVTNSAILDEINWRYIGGGWNPIDLFPSTSTTITVDNTIEVYGVVILNGCSTNTTVKTITFQPYNNIGGTISSSTGTQACTSETFNISISPDNNASSISWVKDDGTNTQSAGSGESITVNSLISSTTYTATLNFDCGPSQTRSITIDPISESMGEIFISSTLIETGESITMDYSGDGTVDQFQIREGAGNWTPVTLPHTINIEGSYKARAVINFECLPSDHTGFKEFQVVPVVSAFSLPNNHIKEKTYNISSSTSISSPTAAEAKISTGYFDGLGRINQQNQKYADNVASADLITLHQYDGMGREPDKYLPFTCTNNGDYDVNAANNQDSYYDGKFGAPNGSYAYIKSDLEASPLGRVLEETGPGAIWHQNNKSTSNSYQSNASSDNVKLYEYDDLQVSASSNYTAGRLFKVVTTDEDDNQTITFTDKEGRAILKKSHTGAEWAETYYIYDDKSSLKVVLPPEANKEVEGRLAEIYGYTTIENSQDVTSNGNYAYTSNSTVTIPAGSTITDAHITPLEVLDEDFVNMWAFQYDYDDRNRMIIKQVPGADAVYMVYDQWDRLVLSQDGNQRLENQWLFTSYDALNRPVITGIIEDNNTGRLSQADMQTYIMSLGGRGLSYDGSGDHGYNNGSYPFTGAGGATIEEILTVTYYDNHDFVEDLGVLTDLSGTSFSRPSALNSTGPFHLLPEENPYVKGQITGTKTRILNTESFIESITFYDEKYRPIQMVSSNHLGGTDKVSNQYDFNGNVRRSHLAHSGGESANILREFDYDHMNRLLTVTHKINDENPVTILENAYNELGELVKKNLHYDGGHSDPVGGDFEQNVDFSYNIRGWLREINQPDLSGSDDLFGMELFYNTASGLSGHQNRFNGNISAMKWSNNDTDGDAGGQIHERGYTYAYDGLNRLTQADHFENTTDINKFDVDGLAYDLNGNIQALQRRSESTSNFMDDLTYSYIGNQLTKVTDNEDNDEGFTDGTNSGDDYGYDPNGNMTFDNNKSITGINYNHLNLPHQVSMLDDEGSQVKIDYLYDAAGIKLKQTVTHYEEQEVLTLNTFYTSDFSATLNGWTGYRALAQPNWNYAGENDAVKVTSSSNNDLHRFQDGIGGGTGGKRRQVKAKIYLPSSNTSVDGIQIQTGFNGGDRSKIFNTYYDQWYTIEYTTTGVPNGSFIFFRMMSGESDVFSGSNNDVFYIKEIEVSEVDGSVMQEVEVPTVTDYVGEFIYKTAPNTPRQLELIQHEEGRIISLEPSHPEFISGSKEHNYQYHLKDHLGNVRVTFSTTPENYTMKEDFEGGDNGFQDLHQHTDANANTTTPYASSNKVGLLQSGETGAMLFLSLNKRDIIDLSVKVNYETAPSGNSFTGTAYSSLFSSFDGVYGSGVEGGVSSNSTVFDDALNGTDMANKSNSSSAPRAFLNYIIFDQDMGYVSAGFMQISTAALRSAPHDYEQLAINDIIADQEGYILAYLSNENGEAVNIHFDDFTVYHGKTNIVSTQDYYPFGLTFNESVRTASTTQNFKYNGFEEQKEWGVFDYQARYYDPAIGRFLMVDPAADLMRSNSPYNYAFNNPIRFIDPDGMMPSDMVGGSQLLELEESVSGSFNPLDRFDMDEDPGRMLDFGFDISEGSASTPDTNGGTDPDKPQTKPGVKGFTGNLIGTTNLQTNGGNASCPTCPKPGVYGFGSGVDYLNGAASLGADVAYNGNTWTGLKNGQSSRVGWGGNQYTGARANSLRLSNNLRGFTKVLGPISTASSFSTMMDPNASSIDIGIAGTSAMFGALGAPGWMITIGGAFIKGAEYLSNKGAEFMLRMSNEFDRAWKNTGGHPGRVFFPESDSLLKVNIHPIELDSALSNVLKLSGYYYEWNQDISGYDFRDGRDIGVLAQEVEELYPELIHYNDKGHRTVDYYKLIPILIQAIKQQQDVIGRYDQKFQKERSQYTELLKRVERLESREDN